MILDIRWHVMLYIVCTSYEVHRPRTVYISTRWDEDGGLY